MALCLLLPPFFLLMGNKKIIWTIRKRLRGKGLGPRAVITSAQKDLHEKGKLLIETNTTVNFL